MKYTAQAEAFAVRIKCKDGRRFLATSEAGTATFYKFDKAKQYLDQLRDHIRRPATMRVVRVKAIHQWEEPA